MGERWETNRRNKINLSQNPGDAIVLLYESGSYLRSDPVGMFTVSKLRITGCGSGSPRSLSEGDGERMTEGMRLWCRRAGVPAVPITGEGARDGEASGDGLRLLELLLAPGTRDS